MWIEALLLVTLAASFAVYLAPDHLAAKLAFALSLLPLGGSLLMYLTFDGSGNALRAGSEIAYETRIEWISLVDYSLEWHVGLDGISMPLVVLSTILATLAIVSAWTPIQERRSQFYGLMLFLEAALLGVFVALDFILWFVFWEAVLIPMYLLIGIWGGPRRKYAAIKFFVYTNVASLVMFIGYVALVFGLGDAVSTFGMPEVAQALADGVEPDQLAGLDGSTVRAGAFAALFLGFAVKVPMVPFHTWLPDAHVEAPSPVSVLLAGVLLKMGTYALLRFNFTMLPEQAADFAWIIAAVAVVSVIYGALLALAQRDLKRIVAYSSVSSMGYVTLGLLAFTVFGMGGATFQMLSHGLISGLMFMVVGVIYNETHTRMVSDMSGLATRMPLTVTAFVAGAFAYMGLPLMSGFAAEFFIFLGSFQSSTIPSAHLVTPLAMFGIVIVAGYLLWAMQRTLFGPYELANDHDPREAPLHDLAPLAVLLGLIVVLGVAPEVAFEMIRDATEPLVAGGEL